MKQNINFFPSLKGGLSALLLGATAFGGFAAGETTLNRLEIKVDGRNILNGFNRQTNSYEIELDEESSSIATFSAAPTSADAIVDITVNGIPYTNHSLGSLVAGENVITYTVKNGGSSNTYTIKVTTPQTLRSEYFTWKNANIYFVLTDRFYNGDTSNDESYHRHKTAGGADVATFHGGDIKGLTDKLDYLNSLGVNAIWITAPYEQMHGWTGGKNDKFPHYAFHGYYTLDWTFMDRNMGTIEDMRNFVAEAHRRGIRVVMDIVLNHTGYSTLDDCVDYDFGNFNGTPVAGYLPASQPFTMWGSGSVSFNADTQGKWGNWWGPWVRAFGDHSWGSVAGFAPEGNDDKTMSLSGLPDVVTERTASVEIPAFLTTKWNAEKGGDYDLYRLPNLEEWRVGGKGAPADYIINWLAGWVEYFGIDGFRCDTAKHVEFNRWNQLKQACKAALARWRQSDRADEYAKGWTDDFWMTGEAWGWDHGDTGYFTQGGYDSMINFAFNGTEGGTGRTPTTGDWEYYANFCNGANGKQVLNYVSSHDTGLHRPGDQKKVATMLLLCPGGAQIYYGDETSRPVVDGFGDAGMATRGDFNWDAVDNDVNKHWQKIGQFRRRNPAVGAGTQTISDGAYIRKFSENGYSNAVAIKLDTQSGQSYTISVGDAFPEGTRVMDGYNTATTATVTGGKVTMTASGPVLLVEEYGTISDDPIPPIPPRPAKPTVSATPGSSEFTQSVSVILSVNPAGVPIHYSTSGTATASSPIYSSPLTFTETTTLSTFVENEAGANTQSFTYAKKQQIIDPIEPEDDYYIYFDDTSKQGVTVWAWGDNEINCTASGDWPGDPMTLKNGKYYWAVPSGKTTPKKVIISWGGHGEGSDERAGGKDLDFVNKHTYKADGSHSLIEYGPQKPSVSVSPAFGTVKGDATIVVTIGNEATSISGTFNGRTMSLSNGANNISVSGYLNDGQSGQMSITATNSVGTATFSGDFTRDDSTPVVSLTGDWRELSIYQIMVASFQHGEGGASGYSDMWGPSGHCKNGNLRGIINSLDYIKDLGMNAIWMTPIFDSTNGLGGEKLQATGYFCTNYFKVDPKFGTEAEFDELIREAHNRGIYVILDGVFGHHGGVNSASPNGKWIQTQDNTQNVRGTESGNIVYPGSLEYFKEVIRYWMERRVDGWRLDQCYQAYQGGHNYWKELREEAEKVASERKARGEQWGTLAYMVGEDWTSAGNVTTTRQDGLKSVMDFDGKDNLVGLSAGVGSVGWFLSNDAASRGYRDSGVNPTIFLSNHDTDRVGDYVDINSNPKGLMTRHAAVAAYSGPACTYYGDEIGDKSGKSTGNGNPDNWARTSGRISGFNANEQMVHDYVAKVFKARLENPALWRGTVERKQQGNNVEIITKTDSQSGNKVICIFSSTDANVSIGGTGLDLINGGTVNGNVSVSAWVPAFIKMN